MDEIRRMQDADDAARRSAASITLAKERRILDQRPRAPWQAFLSGTPGSESIDSFMQKMGNRGTQDLAQKVYLPKGLGERPSYVERIYRGWLIAEGIDALHGDAGSRYPRPIYLCTDGQLRTELYAAGVKPRLLRKPLSIDRYGYVPVAPGTELRIGRNHSEGHPDDQGFYSHSLSEVLYWHMKRVGIRV
jgi:hypothetical protein